MAAEGSGAPRKLYVTLDPLEKVHRTEARRVRALHYLQRRAIDLDIANQSQVEEALQLAVENVARLKDEFAKVAPETAAAAKLNAKLEQAESEVQKLRTASRAATTVAAAREGQRKDLLRKQEMVQSRMLRDFSMQMAGKDLEMVAPVLKYKTQGITEPAWVDVSKGEVAPPLPALATTVKEHLAELEKAEKAVALGSGTNWAADAARVAEDKRAAEARNAALAEHGEEGAGGEAGVGQTEADKAAAQVAMDKKRSRKDRKTPEEEQKDAARNIRHRYAALLPCSHCAAHVIREMQETCSNCTKIVCGRGDKGPDEPRGQPCIEMTKCRCGTVMCYDCYLGTESGSGVFWQRCIACNGHMCPLEWNGAAADCKDCGRTPFCRGCRDPHADECPKTCAKPGYPPPPPKSKIGRPFGSKNKGAGKGGNGKKRARNEWSDDEEEEADYSGEEDEEDDQMEELLDDE